MPDMPFYGFGFWCERSFRVVGGSYADVESPAPALTFGRTGKVEVIFFRFYIHTREPTWSRSRAVPGNFVLGENNSQVSPVGQVGRGKYMIVGHAEPFFQMFYWAGYVVRRGRYIPYR